MTNVYLHVVRQRGREGSLTETMYFYVFFNMNCKRFYSQKIPVLAFDATRIKFMLVSVCVQSNAIRKRTVARPGMSRHWGRRWDPIDPETNDD